MNLLKHIIVYSFSLFCALILMGCSSDSFKIEGNIEGLGTQNVRILYFSGDEVKSIWLPAVNGKFTFDGASKDPVVVSIFNQHKSLLANLYVQNGDHLNVSGNIKDKYKFEVTGNDVAEEWNDFIVNNSAIFEKGNLQMIDIAIEKYVKANPKSIVSSLLLMYDYNNLDNLPQMSALFNSLNESARPPYIMNIYKGLDDEISTLPTDSIVAPFNLYSNADSIEGFNPSFSKISVLYFWINDEENRNNVILQLKDLNKKYSKKNLQIADITLENDSALWKRTIKNDSVAWKQFWSLGGRFNSSIIRLGIAGAPYFIVTDSVGKQLYHGNSSDEAYKVVEEKLATKPKK